MILVLLAFGSGYKAMAQWEESASIEMPAPRISSFNASLGLDWMKYREMNLNRLLAFAENPRALQQDLTGLTEDVNSTSTGAALLLNVSLTPYNRRTQELNTHREIRIGVQFTSPREAMVAYKDEATDTSIVFCNLHGEIGLDGAYIVKGKLLKRLNGYAGIGSGVSITYANEMILLRGKYFEPGEHPMEQEITEENHLTYKAKPAFYTKVFLPMGLYYQINETWELGLDIRAGMGLQFIANETTAFLPGANAFFLGMRYSIGI